MKAIAYLLIFLVLTSCVQNKKINNSTPSLSELDLRIKMASERLVFGKEPEITEDFLLAGVTLDSKFPVRFSEFSGDQVGRYLSTFSRMKVTDNPIDLDSLVRKVIATQKKDGRFGDENLVFDPSKLTGNHMALLWGNGRLLTGLMDYYAVNKNQEALQAALKLGEFLTAIAQSCTRPDVIEKFKEMGAMGFICFTQITDGLVKLYVHTSDKKYVELATSIYKLLPEFGNQHSHGYLNTVLGVVGLYNATSDTSHLNFAKRIYQQVISSNNYLITGGVAEFFGKEGVGYGIRDEGCSEADFVMLSLELWKATNDIQYLDKMEFCLHNALMYNQYNSGDFGSHPFDENFGFTLSSSQGRAWWCCDYHGLQALLMARDIIVTGHNGVKQINLYSDIQYNSSDLAFTISKAAKNKSTYSLAIDSSRNLNQGIAFRIPYWVSAIKLAVNGKETDEKPINGYIELKRVWKKGDVVTIDLAYKLQLIDFERKAISVSTLPEKPFKAALQYGPYLMSVDDAISLPFMAEPSGGNIIYLNSKDWIDGKPPSAQAPDSSNLGEAYLKMDYKHDGYYTNGQVTMRPMSEATHGPLPNVQLWFNFEEK